MFRGAGKLGLRSISSPKIMYAPRANTFKLTLESTVEDARAYPYGTCGIRQIVDTIVTQQTYKLSLGIESFDPEDIAFIMGEQIAVTNPTFPEVQNATIPAIAVPTLTNIDLILDQSVSITILDSLSSTRMLTQVPSTTATLAVGQFKVGTGLITFHAGDAGKPINYMYDKAFTNMRSIGIVQNPTLWGDVSFSGIVCGSRFNNAMRIFVPAMYVTPKFDLAFGDKSTAELEFTLKTTGNYRVPLLFGDI